ncbi:YHYH protein [uncultured Paraglaciecola sp.]|uniref:YHYH protein n=1 Tax=uncultured Paraglaciecola sp. TaxID=1765024 RepID=UPI0030D70507|tara:strand:+ start:6288 stop:7133 length:846 start_codon:yes stop_codon:yes gene_type:complete
MQTNLSQYFITSLITLGLTLALSGCNGSSDSSVDTVDTIESSDSATDTEIDSGDSSDEVDTGSGILHSAYYEFDTDHVEVVLNGDTVSIETNGLPNHTSPYWSADHALFVEPTVTSYEQMAPGNIDEFVGTYTLTVDNTPEKSADTSATGLGAIGIAVSGSVIYNDEEGPGIALDGAVGSLDFNGAHTGPQSYHYHLEPISFSEDDSNLIGVIADGFFLYGRKCNSTGTYPTDLDASGGHTSITQHTQDAEYHYHIQNEVYLGAYYILFPGDYQGSASAIR